MKTEEVERGFSRRAFIASGMAVGIGAGLAPLGGAVSARPPMHPSGKLGKGDAAILGFSRRRRSSRPTSGSSTTSSGGIQDSEVPGAAAAGLYRRAEVLDEDMPQYIHDNTDDEFRTPLSSTPTWNPRGATPVNLDPFRDHPEQQSVGGPSRSGG